MLSVGSARQFILTRKATLLSDGKGGGEASGIIVVFYLHLRAVSPSLAPTNFASWQPCSARKSLGWGERGGARACAWGTHVPGQGEKRETEANRLMLLQQVCSRNNTRDQPPGFPLSVKMRSLCSMKEEKFPAIQNTQGKRQAAEPPMPVPVQQVAVVGSNGHSRLIGPIFLFFGNVRILTHCFKIAQSWEASDFFNRKSLHFIQKK